MFVKRFIIERSCNHNEKINMPQRNINNCIQSWKSLTEPSYPLMYINRWIPFNAWYMSVTGQLDDRSSFQYFKDNTGNALYSRIKQLIQKTTSNFDCIFFQNQFNLLEDLLKNRDVPAPDASNPIYFGLIELRPNTTTFDAMNREGGMQFKVVRYQKNNTQGKPSKSVEVIAEDLRSHAVSVIYNCSEWNLGDFSAKIARMRSYNTKQKKLLKELFNSINPIVIKDVKDVKGGCIKIGKSKFCNDKDAISASIMHVLYELRCKAVHAEIDVTPKTLQIYEYAYNMLTLITKELY